MLIVYTTQRKKKKPKNESPTENKLRNLFLAAVLLVALLFSFLLSVANTLFAGIGRFPELSDVFIHIKRTWPLVGVYTKYKKYTPHEF